MKRTLALCVLLGVALGCGPPTEDKIFPYSYAIDDLDNGLRLVTVTTEFPDVVALYIVVQVGSRNEVEPGRSGFAHLFEHMMFRGTEKFPPEKWEAVMQSAGGGDERLHHGRPDRLSRRLFERRPGAHSRDRG